MTSGKSLQEPISEKHSFMHSGTHPFTHTYPIYSKVKQNIHTNGTHTLIGKETADVSSMSKVIVLSENRGSQAIDIWTPVESGGRG